MRSLAMLFCVFVAGCAGSLGSLSGEDGAAPDWFEAKKAELRGKDYPRLGQLPENANYKARQSGLVQSAEERDALREAFFNDPRSTPVSMTPAEILAWGESKRDQFATMDLPSNFLTDDDIAALFALFERPRARR